MRTRHTQRSQPVEATYSLLDCNIMFCGNVSIIFTRCCTQRHIYDMNCWVDGTIRPYAHAGDLMQIGIVGAEEGVCGERVHVVAGLHQSV
eukprot:324334-Chlamydomonas_euryale.AAC.2